MLGIVGGTDVFPEMAYHCCPCCRKNVRVPQAREG